LIVGDYFDGDTDTDTSWEQHDVYHQALRSLIGTCNRLAQFAKAVLDDQHHEDWGEVESCDHRTLQAAHDLLAAVWRYRHADRQGTLPFMASFETSWLDWLHAEVFGWIDHPGMVRAVQILLTNQNKPLGYTAETDLCRSILARFSDVPWKLALRQAYESEPACEHAILYSPDRGDQGA
jgi:hypothetical protein